MAHVRQHFAEGAGVAGHFQADVEPFMHAELVLHIGNTSFCGIHRQRDTELFGKPDSRWAALSRERMRTTRALWKRELDAKRIPYQDYMLE